MFFFQAEDGIRDLVRSRGLGDVYKRQVFPHDGENRGELDDDQKHLALLVIEMQQVADHDAVSYTHLTLPTSDLV